MGLFQRQNYNNVIQINGVTIATNGNNIAVRNGEVIVDGEIVATNIGNNKIIVNGDCGDIDCNGSVEVSGNSGSIDCGGSCEVNGDVSGNIDAGGSVTCGNVNGDIDCGGSVKCRR